MAPPAGRSQGAPTSDMAVHRVFQGRRWKPPVLEGQDPETGTMSSFLQWSKQSHGEGEGTQTPPLHGRHAKGSVAIFKLC